MVETFFRWTAGILAYITLAIVFFGIWRGTRRPPGRTSGNTAGWLRSFFFYFLATACFLILSVIFWKPIPINLTPSARLVCLLCGVVLYFPGMTLILWGRLTLGKMYFVSTSMGAQLYADHEMVVRGPYSIVRHPMYLGLVLSAAGSLLIYTTWTSLLFACFAPFVLFRARREEQALAAEFGEQWKEYCNRVPRFIPFVKKRGKYDRFRS